jgi:general secretion pathway protein N
MTRPPPGPLPRRTVQKIGTVPVMPGERMLRISWRALLVVAAVALHGSTAGPQMTSADPTNHALVRAMPRAAIDIAMPAVSGNPVAAVPLDRLSETRNRPLFSPSRRPPAPPAPAAIAARVERAPQALPPLSPPGVALFGTVIGAQGARAFIAMGAANRIIGVRPGDDVSGWTVTAITQRNLVLSRAELSATFTLFSSGNASQIERSDAAVSNPQATRTADPPRGRVRIR